MVKKLAKSDRHTALKKTVWDYYAAHGRHDLPWRETFEPYQVLVSELMLQQTQVARVIPKFTAFLATFPTLSALATADLSDVLRHWQGLGYNRRAKFLWQCAQTVVGQPGGVLPRERSDLLKLPGVGTYTASAIQVFAYNQPVTLIETNVRQVYIHHYFSGCTEVKESDLVALVSDTVDTTNPRDWYAALMDYGAHLKTVHGNNTRVLSQYRSQPIFLGSRRAVRGAVLRHLSAGPQTANALQQSIHDERVGAVLVTLEAEGLITRNGRAYRLGT
jgi:A/G-specific adenine glycosylase